jgi:transposase
VARKSYSEEFRQQAVDLYRSTPGATVKGIAAELGVTRGALAEWVKGRPVSPVSPVSGVHAPDGPSGAGAGPQAGGQPSGQRGRPAGAAGRIAALEAENAALRAAAARRDAEHDMEVEKLSTERDILRQAAKYFAGETNW